VSFSIFPSHHSLLPNLALCCVLYQNDWGRVRHQAVFVQLAMENVFAGQKSSNNQLE